VGKGGGRQVPPVPPVSYTYASAPTSKNSWNLSLAVEGWVGLIAHCRLQTLWSAFPSYRCRRYWHDLICCQRDRNCRHNRPGLTAARVTFSANRSAWQSTSVIECTPRTISCTAYLQPKTTQVEDKSLADKSKFRKLGHGQIAKDTGYLIYTVSQKKLCQLIFCSLSVKYEPISIKIGRTVPEETLNKTVPNMPTSTKVCACTTLGNLKWQNEPSQ